MYTLYVIFLFSLNIFLFHAYPESALEEQDRDCIKSLNLTAAFVVNNFNKYNLITEGNADMNRFVNCTWTSSGYLSKNGVINPEALITWLQNDLIKKLDENQPKVTAESIVDPCKSIRGDDSGDTAVKVYNCMMRTYLIPNGFGFDESDFDQTDLLCLKELNLEKKVIIDSYDKDNFIREGIPQMNSFFTCAWKKDQLQQSDGTMNEVNLVAMVDHLLEKRMDVQDPKIRERLSKQGVNHCKGVKGSDDGDTCVKMYNCLLKNIVDSILN
ncbi:hypothetical protein FQR65_LT00901 [Abscondita terminalis]|nr:hypothetical protein FQR65_LT00901 [Abscondita terminalis]